MWKPQGIGNKQWLLSAGQLKVGQWPQWGLEGNAPITLGEICLWCSHVPITLAGSTQWNMLIAYDPVSAKLNHKSKLLHLNKGAGRTRHPCIFTCCPSVQLYCTLLHPGTLECARYTLLHPGPRNTCKVFFESMKTLYCTLVYWLHCATLDLLSSKRDVQNSVNIILFNSGLLKSIPLVF